MKRRVSNIDGAKAECREAGSLSGDDGVSHYEMFRCNPNVPALLARCMSKH